MPAFPLDVVRIVKGKLRRLEALIPPAFLAPPFMGGEARAAAHTSSFWLIAPATAALIASLAAFAAWVLITDRRARKPRHVPWPDEDWSAFERSFWAHLKRRSDPAPPAGRDRDEV